MNTKHGLPDQPEGIDEMTRDLPTVAGAAERVGTFLSEFGDGVVLRLDEDRDGDRPALFARDLETLIQLAKQPWVIRTLALVHFAENECADAHCGFHETLGQHATFQHTDGAGA